MALEMRLSPLHGFYGAGFLPRSFIAFVHPRWRGGAEGGGCGFAVFETVGKDAEHEGLHFGDGLIPGGSVGHGAGDDGNFGDPAAVLLAFDLYFHLGSFGRGSW